ncbi:hypothetical protein PQ469_24645 [Mucilaginibacter sp. KACC 22773]|uniref:hypothetical protein n=1 Tax=Mucilaginibacter sp. KACC 22773 TaxID=3025671 RepID=UPI0023669069|nr:hypothetical protein [Mucilaginibacter sp. KACC 22773]WDF77077.1 hypothetical protein PQ469_24645 [Mucilaginibacter sp. KACC 22773]
MKTLIFCYILPAIWFFFINATQAQPPVKVINGVIFVGNSSLEKNGKMYAMFIDSLDKKLKANVNDTTSLFYRALFYLQYNSFVVNPDLSTNRATNKLLLARKMADRADSLKMHNFNLKVLRAQIFKELANRYAPIETWRFNDQQLADRKKKFEYFKNLANQHYAQLAEVDKSNAWDYQKLKIKDY